MPRERDKIRGPNLFARGELERWGWCGVHCGLSTGMMEMKFSSFYLEKALLSVVVSHKREVLLLVF